MGMFWSGEPLLPTRGSKSEGRRRRNTLLTKPGVPSQ
jgi:hypothetical protein